MLNGLNGAGFSLVSEIQQTNPVPFIFQNQTHGWNYASCRYVIGEGVLRKIDHSQGARRECGDMVCVNVDTVDTTGSYGSGLPFPVAGVDFSQRLSYFAGHWSILGCEDRQRASEIEQTSKRIQRFSCRSAHEHSARERESLPCDFVKAVEYRLMSSWHWFGLMKTSTTLPSMSRASVGQLGQQSAFLPPMAQDTGCARGGKKEQAAFPRYPADTRQLQRYWRFPWVAETTKVRDVRGSQPNTVHVLLADVTRESLC